MPQGTMAGSIRPVRVSSLRVIQRFVRGLRRSVWMILLGVVIVSTGDATPKESIKASSRWKTLSWMNEGWL